jgi:DNA-binding CsgD family transcriptional regulator
MTSLPYNVPREKRLLRRFAAGKTDAEIARELNDRESRIAVQRQRLAEKFQIDTDERFVEVAHTLGRYPAAKTRNIKTASRIAGRVNGSHGCAGLTPTDYITQPASRAG